MSFTRSTAWESGRRRSWATPADFREKARAFLPRLRQNTDAADAALPQYTHDLEKTAEGWRIRRVMLDPIHFRGNPLGLELAKGKRLVWRDFRTLKTGLLEIRPLFLRKAGRTRGHALVSMLALKLVRQLERRVQPLGLTVKDALARLEGVRLVTLADPKLGLWSLPSRWDKPQQQVLAVLPCATSAPSLEDPVDRDPRLANLQRAAKLPWTDGGRCAVQEASKPWPVLAERCYHALDHERVEFHDTTGRCSVASAGAAAVGLGVCVLAAPEIVVRAVIVTGVVVVGFAIKEALDTYAEKRGRPQVTPVPETKLRA